MRGGIYKAADTTGTSGISGPEPPPDTLASMCWKQKTASTYYVYGNGQVLAEYANPAVAGSPQAKYIYAGDRRIAMIDQSGNLFFYLNDHLGSARVVMNAQTGRAADYHWYYAYGEVWGEHTSTNQAYKYTGKPFDDEGGFDLYYYGARYYDPDRGFISVDPLDSKYPGWSPYVYTLDNPLKYVDPDGEKVEYASGASQQFKQDFAKAIKYMNEKGISGTFTRLEKHPETVFVGPGPDRYIPSSNTIEWDPNLAAELTSGGRMSPALILLHEAGHAEQELTNPQQYQNDRNTPDAQYTNKEEKRNIENVETPAAKKAGEGTRTDHKVNNMFPVNDPTKNDPFTSPLPPQTIQ